MDVLARARTGDEQAFAELVEPHRRELHLHCYRMLGSLDDADDALQEIMVAAWQSLAGFEGRSSWRTWLYRIATNRCLNFIRTAGRRPRIAPVPPFTPPPPTDLDSVTWLEPYPDAYLDELADRSPEPAARSQAREGVELAFIELLQRLPPRQAAALVLRDVLGFGTSEVAEMLDTTAIAIKGALARARATMATELPPDRRTEADDRRVSQRFAEAFTADDIDGVVALLTDDAWLAMPPAPHRYHGPIAIAGFLRASAAGRPGHLRVRPVAANRQPAFACSIDGSWAGLVVLAIAGDRITGVTRFLGDGLAGRFGQPSTLDGLR